MARRPCLAAYISAALQPFEFCRSRIPSAQQQLHQPLVAIQAGPHQHGALMLVARIDVPSVVEPRLHRHHVALGSSLLDTPWQLHAPRRGLGRRPSVGGGGRRRGGGVLAEQLYTALPRTCKIPSPFRIWQARGERSTGIGSSIYGTKLEADKILFGMHSKEKLSKISFWHALRPKKTRGLSHQTTRGGTTSTRSWINPPRIS